MTDTTSILAICHWKWAAIQAPFNILLTADKSWLVINKAKDKAHYLHWENPNGKPKPAGVIPLRNPNWETNSKDLTFLEHYRRYILEGLKEGVSKQKILPMIQAIQQKQSSVWIFRKGPSCLSRAHWCWPTGTENCLDGECDFYWSCAPDIRKKVPMFRWVIGNETIPAGRHSH